MRKLIFCDVDGTIVEEKKGVSVPTEKTVYAFRELKKNHDVFIASGRTTPFLETYIRDLEPTGYLLANGGLILLNGEYVYEQPFTLEEDELMRSFCRERGGMYLLEHRDYAETGDLENENFKYFYNRWKPMRYAEFELKGKGDPSCIAILRFSREEDKDEFFKRYNDRFELRPHNNLTSFDVNPKGVTKGLGILETMKILGVKKEDVYAYGDGNNDLEMLEAAGVGVAMGNASPYLKERADEICGRVEEDGFYYSLVEHGLIPPIGESE